MVRRHWPVLAFALLVVGVGLNLQAQTPAAPKSAAPTVSATDFNAKELTARQQAVEQQYKAFTLNLLSLARKLKASTRVEDQDKAKTLEKAIELADKEGVDNKFTMLLRTLSKSGDLGLNDLTKAGGQQDDIIKAMSAILAILQSDDELARIKAEKEALEKHLADLNNLIRGEKIVQARNDSGKGDKDQLAAEQKKLAELTNKLAERMGAPKDAKPADPKAGDPKGEQRDPGKGQEGKGEDKKDTDKPKGEASKPGDKPMGGDPKDPKKDPMAGGDAKPSKGPPKDGASDAKPGKPGDPKEASGGKPMGGGKPMDPMKTDPKKDEVAKDNKPAESRNKEDNKGEEKGAAPKPEQKDAQASAGKPGGDPKAGQPGAPKPASPGGSPPPPGSSPPSPPKPAAPGADAVKKAVPDEQNAAAELEKNDRPKASDEQAKAIEKMEQARQELEKRLKQLREQELERLLANLETRVGKMLAMQIEVKGVTVTIDGQVQKNPDQKPRPVDFQNSQKQEDREGEIIAEADKAIELLHNEGSAVAFPAVFEEVRVDMSRAKERLHNANVGSDTQALEDDIILVLTQMKDALKKAQQELSKQPPMPSDGMPPPDGPQLKKLLDEIAELKLIRQQQQLVNTRTTRYGDRFKGEQADDMQIKKELKDLGERQEKIETMIHNMVTGKNK